MFEKRRTARREEIARLSASLDVIAPPAAINEGERGRDGVELAALHAVVAIADPLTGIDRFAK